jgi:hypothetical protein
VNLIVRYRVLFSDTGTGSSCVLKLETKVTSGLVVNCNFHTVCSYHVEATILEYQYLL